MASRATQLSDEELSRLRRAFKQGEATAAIATDLGVNKTTVTR
jgi:IS30 family transposase